MLTARDGITSESFSYEKDDLPLNSSRFVSESNISLSLSPHFGGLGLASALAAVVTHIIVMIDFEKPSQSGSDGGMKTESKD